MFKLKIKKFRKQLNLTQKELANRCNLSQGYLSCLESNHRSKSPTLRTVETIASALGICPFELLEYTCDKCKDKK